MDLRLVKCSWRGVRVGWGESLVMGHLGVVVERRFAAAAQTQCDARREGPNQKNSRAPACGEMQRLRPRRISE